jgi:hypothetical protein
MIIPSGGLDSKHGKWIAADEAFFLNVRALSRVFRAKFVKILRKEYFRGSLTFLDVNRHIEDCTTFYNLIDSTFKNDWNVYAKRPFHNALSVLKYLGGYTHRIAFANHRLISFDENHVTFRIKDRAAQKVGAQGAKTATLSTKEFMRRFLMHVLPRGLQRIRHFGFLGSSCKEKSLTLARSLLPERTTSNSQSVAEMVVEFSASQSVSTDQCVSCKQGTMHPVPFLLPFGPSPELHIEQGVSNSS